MSADETTLTISLDEPHAGQQRVIQESARFNVLQCGRRFGKTTLGLDRLIAAALEGHPAAWFAPSYKLLADVWRQAKAALAPLTPAISEQERHVELLTGGILDFWSLDQPDAGRGRKYKRVVIDEAGLVRNLEAAWNEAIRPTLADLKGDAWFLGTPKGRNYFHRLYARGESGDDADWRSWRMPTTANPAIDASEVNAAKRDMPPAAFNQEFLGIPADDGGNPFGIDAIRKATVPGLSLGVPVAFGVDLAKSEDWTVVCGVDANGRVCVLERWQSDWGQTTRRVTDMIGVIPTFIDSTGVGDPIVEAIKRGTPTADGFKFTATTKQQLMEGLAASFQRQEIRVPDGWLVNELESFEYEYRAGGVRYSAPEGMHDDGVCALALAVAKRDEQRYGPRQWGSSDLGTIFDRRHRIATKSAHELLIEKLKANRSN